MKYALIDKQREFIRMRKEKRYLITTADERTWKFDRPVIFLGEWCRLYDRKHVWQHMDAIVASPYGLGMKKKDADYTEANLLKEKIFIVLCDTLNKHHGTHHDARFWRIVLGPWITRYVHIMLSRVKTLEQCLHMHLVSGTTVYANDQYTLATPDTYSSVLAAGDYHWDNLLNVRLLDLLGLGNCPVEKIEDYESAGFRVNESVTTPTFKKTILKKINHQVRKLLSLLARDDDAFIISSYLPKKNQIKLQLALMQCPQLWVSPKLKAIDKPDRALRERLARKFTNQSDDNLENILSLMLFQLLPICYLEGFSNLNKLAKQQPWPKSPKFIFTSNNFEFDEVFKLWTAKKVESGSKYFVGQHGNNYATYRYAHHTNEEKSADKFLTWGWMNGLQQHIPAFILKTAGKSRGHYNPLGGLLLIERHLGHRIRTWDITHEFGKYFEDQLNLVSKLATSPKLNLTIRMSPASNQLNWHEKSRWQAFDPSLRIDNGAAKISDLISNNRLIVHSYDSTGILETLSQNIPTLAFWQNGFEHLHESVIPYYQLLVDAGIVHLSSESVAHKVNEVWDDVNTWWGQNKVQNARKKFCERYAKQTQSPTFDLMHIFSN